MNTFTTKLLNIITPNKINGVDKVKLYTTVNSNFNIGDYVYIINGNYDNANGKPYKVLAIDTCSITIDLDYVSNKPLYNIDNINEFTKVYLVDSVDKFNYENADNGVGNAINVGIKYSKNNNYIFLSKLKNLPLTDSKLSYNRFFKSYDDNEIDITKYPKITYGSLISSTATTFTASTINGVGLTYGISGNLISDMYVDYGINDAYLYVANTSTSSSTYSKLWVHDIKTDNLSISPSKEVIISSVYNNLSYNTNTFTSAFTFSNGYMYGHFGLYSSDVVVSGSYSSYTNATFLNETASSPTYSLANLSIVNGNLAFSYNKSIIYSYGHERKIANGLTFSFNNTNGINTLTTTFPLKIWGLNNKSSYNNYTNFGLYNLLNDIDTPILLYSASVALNIPPNSSQIVSVSISNTYRYNMYDISFSDYTYFSNGSATFYPTVSKFNLLTDVISSTYTVFEKINAVHSYRNKKYDTPDYNKFILVGSDKGLSFVSKYDVLNNNGIIPSKYSFDSNTYFISPKIYSGTTYSFNSQNRNIILKGDTIKAGTSVYRITDNISLYDSSYIEDIYQIALGTNNGVYILANDVVNKPYINGTREDREFKGYQIDYNFLVSNLNLIVNGTSSVNSINSGYDYVYDIKYISREVLPIRYSTFGYNLSSYYNNSISYFNAYISVKKFSKYLVSTKSGVYYLYVNCVPDGNNLLAKKDRIYIELVESYKDNNAQDYKTQFNNSRDIWGNISLLNYNGYTYQLVGINGVTNSISKAPVALFNDTLDPNVDTSIDIPFVLSSTTSNIAIRDVVYSDLYKSQFIGVDKVGVYVKDDIYNTSSFIGATVSYGYTLPSKNISKVIYQPTYVNNLNLNNDRIYVATDKGLWVYSQKLPLIENYYRIDFDNGDIPLNSYIEKNNRLLISDSFEYDGKTFEKGKIYKYDSVSREWVLDITYNESIITKSNFKNGSFKSGIWNDGLLGSNNETAEWIGDNVTFKNGIVYNSIWKSGNVYNNYVNGATYYYGRLDANNNVNIINDKLYNNGYGFSYFIDSVIESGSFVAINTDRTKIGLDLGTFSQIYLNKVSSTQSINNINIGKSSISNSEVNYLGLSNSYIYNTIVNNSILSNNTLNNVALNKSIMRSGDIDNSGFIKILKYDKWQSILKRNDVNDGIGVLTIHKFFITEDDLNKISYDDDIIINNITTNNSSLFGILNDIHKMKYLSSDGYSFESFEDIEKIDGDNIINFKKLVSKRSPNQNKKKTILAKDANNKLFVKTISNTDGLASIDIAILDMGEKYGFYTSNVDINLFNDDGYLYFTVTNVAGASIQTKSLNDSHINGGNIKNGSIYNSRNSRIIYTPSVDSFSMSLGVNNTLNIALSKQTTITDDFVVNNDVIYLDSINMLTATTSYSLSGYYKVNNVNKSSVGSKAYFTLQFFFQEGLIPQNGFIINTVNTSYNVVIDSNDHSYTFADDYATDILVPLLNTLPISENYTITSLSDASNLIIKFEAKQLGDEYSAKNITIINNNNSIVNNVSGSKDELSPVIINVSEINQILGSVSYTPTRFVHEFTDKSYIHKTVIDAVNQVNISGGLITKTAIIGNGRITIDNKNVDITASDIKNSKYNNLLISEVNIKNFNDVNRAVFNQSYIISASISNGLLYKSFISKSNVNTNAIMSIVENSTYGGNIYNSNLNNKIVARYNSSKLTSLRASAFISGTFTNGLINNSEWYDGVFLNGSLINSKFLGGTFTNGIFGDKNTNPSRNIFYRGNWINGTFNNGVFGYNISYVPSINISDYNKYSSINYLHTISNDSNAKWYNGVFNAGIFTGMNDGTSSYTNLWYDGIFNNGEVADSVRWFNGTFNNGVFKSTYGDGITKFSWDNGIFNGGIFGDKLNTPTTWYNGVFNGGMFIGKLWNNGTFLKGTFEGSGIATYSNVNDNIFVHGALYPSKFIEPYNTTSSYYGLWRNGTVTIDKYTQTAKSLSNAIGIDIIKKKLDKSLNRDTVIFNNVLWVNGHFNHSNGQINNSVWLSGTFSDGKFNYSSFNPYVLRKGDYISTSSLKWSSDFTDNTIWKNGKLYKSNFWISKWENGTFEGGGNDYNDGEIDQTNGAMISANFKKGTANYINAYNVIWENGRFRNGNWYGANFALEFSKNDIPALYYLGETFESSDPKNAKFIESMLVNNNIRLQNISGTAISETNRLFAWNTFINSSINQYIAATYNGSWVTTPNPLIIAGITTQQSSSSGEPLPPVYTLGLSASAKFTPSTVFSNSNISYTFDANTTNPNSVDGGNYTPDTKNITMESIFYPSVALDSNTVYGISISSVNIPSNTTLTIQYEKNTNQYVNIATLTNNNVAKVYTIGVYSNTSPKLKFIVNSTITNNAGSSYNAIKVNKKIQLNYSIGLVNTEGVYKETSNNMFSGTLQYNGDITTIKNTTYNGNDYQSLYTGVTISVDTDITSLAVSLNNNIETIKTMVGNGVFLEGIWENGVWSNGARTYTPYSTRNRTIVADNIISTYKINNDTWNIVIGVPDVNNGNGNSGILDLLSFMTDGNKVVSDKLVSVGNIIATDINGNRKLIKSLMTARLGTINNQVISDTIIIDGGNSDVHKNKLQKFNINNVDYYVLILTYKETFPINNISKDSENHPIYITKNVWMNGVFLNGLFEGVWMNGYVKGGPKVTVLKNTQWVDGTFDGGRFISTSKNSIGLTYTPVTNIELVDGNNTVFKQNASYPKDTLNTGLVQNMKFNDNLLLTDTNDIPTSSSVLNAKSYTYLSHMDVVYDKFITTSLFDQSIANDRQNKLPSRFYNIPVGQITQDILESSSTFIYDNPNVGNTFNQNRYTTLNVKLGTKYRIYNTPFDADFSKSPNNSINLDIPSVNNPINLASYSLYGWTHGNSNLSNTSTVNNISISNSFLSTSNIQNGDLIIGGFNNFITRNRYSMIEVITKTSSLSPIDYTSPYYNHNRSVLQIGNGYNVYPHDELSSVTYSNVINDLLPYMSANPDKPIYTYVYNNHGGYRNSIWLFNNNLYDQRYYRIRYYEVDMIPFYNYFTYSNTDGVYWWDRNNTRAVYNKAIIPYKAISPFINYDDNKYSLIDNIKFIGGGVQKVRTIIKKTNTANVATTNNNSNSQIFIG